VEGSKDGTTLNPGQLARLDALVAACINTGSCTAFLTSIASFSGDGTGTPRLAYLLRISFSAF
jgi:hypothetical protein